MAHNTGAGNRARAPDGFRAGLLLLACLGFCLSCLLRLSASACVALVAGNAPPAVSEAGEKYLRLTALFHTLCFIGNAFVGWYRGSGRVGIPVWGTALHMSIRVVPSSLLIEGVGIEAVALATGMGWCCVVVFLNGLFRLPYTKAAGEHSPAAANVLISTIRCRYPSART